MHPVAEHLVQLLQQLVQPVAGLGAGQQDIGVKAQGVGFVALVVHGQAGDIGAVQPVKHFVGDRKLLLALLVPGVCNPDDHIRPCGFFQRRLERLHQIVGQAGHKADRVHQQHRHTAGQHQLAAGGVQCGKQHIGFGYAGAAQGVHQAGFAHVGVANKAYHGHPGLGACLAAFAPALFHLGQLLGQRINAGVHMAAVQLQLGLTGTAAGTAATATAAALTAQRLAHALQAGQTVAQQRQFGLQLALVGHGAAAENLQDQHGAVDDFQPAQRVGDVADLAAGQLAVKHGAFRAQRLGGKGSLFQLAAAQHDAGLRGLALLGDLRHGFHVVGLAQGRKLCQTALAVPQPLIQCQQHHLCGRGLGQNIIKLAQSKSFLLS